MLHTFSAEGDDGKWHNICQSGPDGRQFPLAGDVMPDGSLAEAPEALEIVCTAGARGKCVRIGYKPWLKTPDGKSMRPHFNACVRMMRADYCGDGTGTTKDGTPIDVSDRLGIQISDAQSGMTFEAAWSPRGTTCLARVRIPENTSLAALIESCPRLREIPLGAACTEELALGQREALLFNRSMPHE